MFAGRESRIAQGLRAGSGNALHAVIFAVKGGVPTVALTYDPKVRSVLRSLDCEQYGYDLEELTSEKLSSLLDRAYTNRLQLRTLLNQKRRTLHRQSLENPRLAAELLSGARVQERALSPSTVDFLRVVRRRRTRSWVDELQAAAGLGKQHASSAA